MRLVVLGAGLQARAICYDLVQQTDVKTIVLVDMNLAAAKKIAEDLNDARIIPVECNARDGGRLSRILRGADAAISAMPYQFNFGLAMAAVGAGINFCDLGGNNTIVGNELGLDAVAKDKNVTVIPDCGLAPGLASILTAHAVKHMDTVDRVSIRVGGVPQEKDDLLNYGLFFNVSGLINEYVEDAVVLRDGQPVTTPSLEDIEQFQFHVPFGDNPLLQDVEAFTTSGGASTLPDTYKGIIQELNYKTLRYPGHAQFFHKLLRFGFLSSEERDALNGCSPRAIAERSLARHLPANPPDVVLVYLRADGGYEDRSYTIVEYPKDGLSAMMRMTAFPASIVLLMLARGQITTKGAIPQERCVDPDLFLVELQNRGIKIRTTVGIEQS